MRKKERREKRSQRFEGDFLVSSALHGGKRVARSEGLNRKKNEENIIEIDDIAIRIGRNVGAGAEGRE